MSVGKKLTFLQKIRFQHGQAATEWALAIIFLCILLTILFELSTMMIQYQKISSLCREAAEQALNRCSDTSEYETCLTQVQTDIAHSATNVVWHWDNESSRILVSYYRRMEGGAIEQMGIVGEDQEFDSKVELTNLNFRNFFNNSNTTVATVGEIYYRYDPVTPIGNLLGYVLPEKLYEIAVY